MIVNLANNPLLFDRGIIDCARERTDGVLDLERWAGCTSPCTGSIERVEVREWMESMFVVVFLESSSWTVEMTGWGMGPSMSWGTWSFLCKSSFSGSLTILFLVWRLFLGPLPKSRMWGKSGISGMNRVVWGLMTMQSKGGQRKRESKTDSGKKVLVTGQNIQSESKEWIQKSHNS